MNALENIVCVLNREVERSSVTLEAFSHQHRLDQEKIENLSNKVRQLERTLTMRDLQLSETEQMVRELQFCTYDGIFVWKISDFSRRRQEAVAGRTPAMFSPGKMKDDPHLSSTTKVYLCIMSYVPAFKSKDRVACKLFQPLACRRGKFHFTTPSLTFRECTCYT